MIMLLNSAWTWSEILWIALIGFSLVLGMLLALVFVMKIFGRISMAAAKVPDSKVQLQPQLSGEEIAALTTALRMHMGERHDRESAILTIMSIKRAYSPWSSKIHGLTQQPQRK
ncbi:MAG: OadG family protein [Rikenellaceae bacterium]